MTATTENTPATEKAKPTQKASVGPKRARVAPNKAKSAKNAKAPKNAPKGVKKSGAARDGSKAAKVLDLLKRPEGATLAELMKKTDWQAHSVRGFLSIAGKKHRLKIESTRTGAGERNYKIAK